MTTFLNRIVLAAVLAAGALVASPGHATTSGGTFQVNATVVSACTVSGTVLSFGGAIDPLSSAVPLDASSSLSVQCTNTTPYAISLNAGTHAGGPSNFSARAMTSGSNSLAYQLYVDSGRSSIWGDGTGSSATSSGTGTGSTQTIPIYGRISSLSGVVPGSYTDTVTVTITY